MTGALTAATASGQLVFLPVLTRLADGPGWRWIGIVIGCSALAVIPIVALFLRNRPEDMGLTAYGAAASEAPAAPSTGSPMRAAFGALSVASRRGTFWLLWGSFMICGLSTTGLVQTHFISAAHEHGISATTAGTYLALIGVFDIVGTVGSGWLTDRFDPRMLLCGYYALRGLSTQVGGALAAWGAGELFARTGTTGRRSSSRASAASSPPPESCASTADRSSGPLSKRQCRQEGSAVWSAAGDDPVDDGVPEACRSPRGRHCMVPLSDVVGVEHATLEAATHPRRQSERVVDSIEHEGEVLDADVDEAERPEDRRHLADEAPVAVHHVAATPAHRLDQRGGCAGKVDGQRALVGIGDHERAAVRDEAGELGDSGDRVVEVLDDAVTANPVERPVTERQLHCVSRDERPAADCGATEHDRRPIDADRSRVGEEVSAGAATDIDDAR